MTPSLPPTDLKEVSFKSSRENFNKELHGLKCNTIRKVDYMDKRFQDLVLMKDKGLGIIELTCDSSCFKRQISDVTFYDDWVIISWQNPDTYNKGFLAGQSASQDRISGIIEKVEPDLRMFCSEKILEQMQGGERISVEEILEKLRSLIKELLAQINNSPKTEDTDNIHDSVPLQSVAQLDLSADRMPSNDSDRNVVASPEGSPTPTIYGGGCPEYNENICKRCGQNMENDPDYHISKYCIPQSNICTCGHNSGQHDEYGNCSGVYRCEEEDNYWDDPCSCQHFTPQPQTKFEGKGE